MRIRTSVLVLSAMAGSFGASPWVHAQQDPIKVFVLAGQSNMEGKGQVEIGANGVVGAIGSLRYQVNNDPANYGHLGDGAGNWNTRSDVFITSTTDGGESGALTVGYGSNILIGPELGFGTVMGDLYGEDVLIIKAAWGGKSLAADFRPPTAVQDRGGSVGEYYDLTVSTVLSALDNIATLVPGYSGQGYQLAGFGWHQGWNDRVNSSFVAEYEDNMADFINDIRFDLGAADLPFVIANTGIGGSPLTGNAQTLALAQLAMEDDPAKYPEFVGNVKSIDTTPFWRDASVSPVTSGNQGFHWNQNGETFYLIGDAIGDEMATMSDYVASNRPYVTVDQQTGEIKLINPGDNLEDMDLEAYQISSATGALNSAQWTSVSGNYDGNGNSFVDSGNWSIVTSNASTLNEAAEAGGDDGLIQAGNEISLGQAWIQNPTRDLLATYTDTDGTVINLTIRYLGFNVGSGDLTGDGSITIDDWAMFVAGVQADMTGLSAAEAFAMGDLDGDMDNDIDDFGLFREAYELDNPAPGAFAAMLNEYAVPEPSSLLLFGAGVLGLGCRRQRTNGRV